MRLSKIVSAVFFAGSMLSLGTPALASMDGWTDRVTKSMVDTIDGWVCDNWLPGDTPLGGVLAVYINDVHHGDYVLNSNTWGFYRPDAASRCNGYQYSGYRLMDWFSTPIGSKVEVFWKFNTGTLQHLGNPIYIVNTPGENY